MFLGCAAFLPVVAFLATNVAAHGYVQSIVADGKNYSGPQPADLVGTLSIQTPIRQIDSETPLILNSTGVESHLLACGSKNNEPATQVVSIRAGSSLGIQICASLVQRLPLGHLSLNAVYCP
jgi:hypothetical protein